jgi:hypothetical protein
MDTRYFVTTWDPELQTFTPQNGVRSGPYSLWGLRRALRALQGMGYDTTRDGGSAVLVERADELGEE